MAKSAAERKAAQRARQLAGGERRIDLPLDAQELEMLTRNCAARRPAKAPYDAAEYIALLIRQDNARLNGLIKSISSNRCRKCGDWVQVTSCPHQGYLVLGNLWMEQPVISSVNGHNKMICVQ